MTAFGYCRISRTTEGDSIEVQRRQVEGYALMHGLELAEIFVDDGVSGAIPVVDRNQGRLLLSRLQSGDTIIAAKVDRMFRSALDALNCVDQFRRSGIRLCLLDLGGDVTSDGLSRFFLTMTAAFAEMERTRIKERVTAAKSHQKKKGRYLGGAVPFGYKEVRVPGQKGAGLVPDEMQQRAIARVLELHQKRMSLRAIADDLRSLGARISHSCVSRIVADSKKGT